MMKHDYIQHKKHDGKVKNHNTTIGIDVTKLGKTLG